MNENSQAIGCVRIVDNEPPEVNDAPTIASNTTGIAIDKAINGCREYVWNLGSVRSAIIHANKTTTKPHPITEDNPLTRTSKWMLAMASRIH